MIKSTVTFLTLLLSMSFSYTNMNERFSEAYKKIEYQNIPALMLYRNIDSVTTVVKNTNISYFKQGDVFSTYSKQNNSIFELRKDFEVNQYVFQFNKDELIASENKILRKNEVQQKKYNYIYETNKVMCIVEKRYAEYDTIIYGLNNNLIISKEMTEGSNKTIIQYKYNKKEQLIRIDKFSDARPIITGEYTWKKNKLIRSVLNNNEGESIQTRFDELQFPIEESFLNGLDTNYTLEYRY